MTMEAISQQTLAEKTKEILDRIAEKHITALVMENDQPTVVILPYETYQQLSQSRKENLQEIYDHIQTWVAKNAESLKGLDSVKLVRETRDSR